MSKIQAKENIALTARLARSRNQQRLKLVVRTGPVVPTADTANPEKRSAREPSS
jgi:hypothetical protein